MTRLLYVACLFLYLGATAAAQKVSLDFKNAEVGDVLAEYERLTGFPVVKSTQVVGPLRVSISTPAPVEKAKAVELLEQTLFASGFSLIQGKSDTVHVLGLGESPLAQGVPAITSIEDLPRNERVVSLVVRLKHREPEELIQLLYVRFVPRMSGIPQFLVDKKTGAIIVTDYSSSVRRITELISQLDLAQGNKP